MRLKKISMLLVAVVFLFGVVGCNQKKKDVVEGNLEEIMDKVYAGFKEEDLPMMMENIEITKENVEGFIGTSEIDYKEALARESMTGSIAHSVVLIRMKDEASVKAAKEKLKEKVDPRKWICVGVEKVTVESRGDLIIVILDDDRGSELLKNFQNILPCKKG